MRCSHPKCSSRHFIGSDVATTLYPHQKKALTFLLDREHEKPASDEQFSSLWRKQMDPMSQRQKWVNIVTDEDAMEEPKEAKGAILADDVCHSFLSSRHF